jgi:hypothetical protein
VCSWLCALLRCSVSDAVTIVVTFLTCADCRPYMQTVGRVLAATDNANGFR